MKTEKILDIFLILFFVLTLLIIVNQSIIASDKEIRMIKKFCPNGFIDGGNINKIDYCEGKPFICDDKVCFYVEGGE